MKKKLPIAILGLVLLVTLIGITKADIKISIEIKDSGDNIIVDGQTVPLGTDVYGYGSYEDQDGTASASALMEVYFYDGGWKYRETLLDETINDGETKKGGPYTLTELGSYQFRWTCEKLADDSTLCQERAQFRTGIHVIPEPGTLAGLVMALSALGLLAAKRIRVHK